MLLSHLLQLAAYAVPSTKYIQSLEVMRIAALPQSHEMPTRREPRNLTQCLCYVTAKANSVTAPAGTMSQAEHTNLALHVSCGLWDMLQTPLLASTDTLSKSVLSSSLGCFSQLAAVLRALICHCSDEQGNRVRWTGHLGELSCQELPKAAQLNVPDPAVQSLPTPGVDGIGHISTSQPKLVPLSSPHNVSIILNKWAEIAETGGFNPPHKSNPWKKGAIQTAKPI